MDKIEILEKIFADVNGYKISHSSRSKTENSEKSFVYGEVEFAGFAKFLQMCEPNSKKIFYDIGSGVGKPCFAAALLFDFKKVIGIEYLPNLCAMSSDLKEKLDLYFDVKTAKELRERVDFINADATKFDFSNADVIFAHATCFDDEMFADLVKRFDEVKVGCQILVITKILNSKNFVEFLPATKFKLEWGDATIRIYEKVK